MKKLTDFLGDPNIGLYGKANDNIVIVSKIANLKDVREVFKDVEVITTTIANTDFVGIFTSFNSNGIVVPKIATEKEINLLKKYFDNILVLNSNYTAVGNLILTNDKGCIVSELLSKEIKEIEDVLGVECIKSKIAGTNVVGSSAIATNKGCIAHRDAEMEEIEKIKSVLKVEVNIGTVNFGSPFVASGIIANSKSALIGSQTSGPELDIIIRTLGI